MILEALLLELRIKLPTYCIHLLPAKGQKEEFPHIKISNEKGFMCCIIVEERNIIKIISFYNQNKLDICDPKEFDVDKICEIIKANVEKVNNFIMTAIWR